MKIDEINDRISELEDNISLLIELRDRLLNHDDGDKYVSAIEDGIKYTQRRLAEYRTTDWIMAVK